jgi:hypothetical protein
MNCAEVNRQIPLYCYGEVDSETEERIESHLGECLACQDELAKHRSFLEVMDRRPHATDAAGADLDSLLVACRSDLRRVMSSGSASGTGWLEALRGLANWHIPFRIPVGAAALVALGFFGARVTPEKFGGVRASMADPMFSNVRSIQSDPSGKVQISVDEIRRHVVTGAKDDPRIRELLLSGAREEENPGVRVDSIDMLKGRADSEEVRQTLVYAVTHDPNAGVRLKALEGLKPYAGDPSVRRTLAAVLQKDENPGVRVQAIDVLTSHRDEAMVGVLQDVAQRENNNYVRARLTRFLEDMKASVGTY